MTQKVGAKSTNIKTNIYFPYLPLYIKPRLPRLMSPDKNQNKTFKIRH